MKWKASFFFLFIINPASLAALIYGVKEKTLKGWTLKACKVTERKHQQASYVGGELNLIRASKKPVFALLKRRCGKPSQSMLCLNTPHIFCCRYYLECRTITQNRTVIGLESYWKDSLFGWHCCHFHVRRKKCIFIKTSSELLTSACMQPCVFL